jgi:hypothetical protein
MGINAGSGKISGGGRAAAPPPPAVNQCYALSSCLVTHCCAARRGPRVQSAYLFKKLLKLRAHLQTGTIDKIQTQPPSWATRKLHRIFFVETRTAAATKNLRERTSVKRVRRFFAPKIGRPKHVFAIRIGCDGDSCSLDSVPAKVSRQQMH